MLAFILRRLGVMALMQMARATPLTRGLLRHGAPDGTFCCFVRSVHYWSGPRQGETETVVRTPGTPTGILVDDSDV